MNYLRRAIGLTIAALVLVTSFAPNTSYAQSTNTITIDGSAIESPILKAASQAYIALHPDVKIDVNVSGTSGGFEKLCGGTLDINMGVRAITDAEAASCAAKNVNSVELLLGYDALAVVVNNASKITCITKDQLDKLLGPNSSDVKNWNTVDATLGDVPISALYWTGPQSQIGVLASSLITGEKVRSDVQNVDTYTQVNDKVNADTAAIGIMSLADYLKPTNNQAVHAVQLKNDSTSPCVDPTIPSLEEDRYPAAESLYLYVNTASLDRKPVADFLSYLLSSDGQKSITASGFALAEDTVYNRGLAYLTAKQPGRTFSRIQTVNVPPDTAGTITVAGSPSAYSVFQSVASAFSPRYSSIKLTMAPVGNESGLANLCANSVDMIGTDRLPTDAEANVCQQANIQMMKLKLGTQAVVLVVNGNNKFATCLTTDQIATIFRVESEGKVKKWSDVDASFPSTDLLLLTLSDGASETDFLLGKTVKGVVAPLPRKDTTQNNDSLYRAAATQNVEGAITYMTYNEYQKVKSNVHTVSVNAGSGCVEPTEANLINGSYPLSQTLYAILNPKTFSRPEVKAFVWYLLSDDALTVIRNGVVGTDTAGFIANRDTALSLFAQQPVSQPTAVGTAAATAAQ